MTLPSGYDRFLGGITKFLQNQRKADGSYHTWILALPNALTYSRISIVPLAWVLATMEHLHHSGVAAIVMVIIVVLFATDAVDGAIARATDNTSQTGANLDPTIDKLACFSLLAGLVVAVHGAYPALMMSLLVVVLIRAVLDGLMAVGAKRQLSAGLAPKSEIWGKYRFHLDVLAVVLGNVGLMVGSSALVVAAVATLFVTCPLAVISVKAHWKPLVAN